jgi:hypothetical protein
MLAGRFVVSVSLMFGACGDSGGGAVDAPIVPLDIDNGSCGDQIRFTGEYVDWDNDASFCGINDALIEVPGGAMDNTAPNGRFDLCIPDAPTTRLDVTQPSANSQCTTPPAPYTVPTILFASKAVIQSGAFYSARAFTTARQQSFFTMVVGQPFDPSKAQVFVHIDGPARALSLAAAHGPTQAVMTTMWAAGTAGHEVFFPNVDVSGGTTMLTTDGGVVGTGAIPLVAGTITNVTIKTYPTN